MARFRSRQERIEDHPTAKRIVALLTGQDATITATYVEHTTIDGTPTTFDQEFKIRDLSWPAAMRLHTLMDGDEHFANVRVDGVMPDAVWPSIAEGEATHVLFRGEWHELDTGSD